MFCNSIQSLKRFEVFPTVTEISANTYWRSPFNSVCSTKELTDYTVLEIDSSINRGMHAMKSKVC